jgi:flagellar motor switch protein FliG
MDAKNLPGSVKVAILIQTLSKAAAERILGSLGNEERQLVVRHIDQMGAVSPELSEKVAREFAELVKNKRARRIDNRRPSGYENGGSFPSAGKEAAKGLRALLELDPETLYNLVKDEHPQTIAIVLVHLDTATASDILARLSDELKTDVAVRIAALDKVAAGMVEEINTIFEEILKNKGTTVARVTGGVERLAEILNQTDEHSSETVMTTIEETNPELAAQIKQKMFVFEDLVLVDDRGFQKLLRRVETNELATALKAASEEVKEKVFKNMSARAGEMLREEMEDMGPVRMKDVSEAQQKITSIIQEMEAKAELVISGRRGEQFVA